MEINFILLLVLTVYVMNYICYDKFCIHWFCTSNGFWNY